MKIKIENPDPKLLVSMPYDYPGKKIIIETATNEFTCVCPWSGQPDFAKITIRYIPNRKCVELKSLKLYLQSYRNVGIVHENAVNEILGDLLKLVVPKWLFIEAVFNARGGIVTTVTAEHGKK